MDGILVWKIYLSVLVLGFFGLGWLNAYRGYRDEVGIEIFAVIFWPIAIPFLIVCGIIAGIMKAGGLLYKYSTKNPTKPTPKEKDFMW